jgi:ParB family transcriptional regulator, chromosome partitioning protein
MIERDISEIKIGKRYREDLGDIDELAASIAELGLLHPIVVSQHNLLLAGERRLEAFKQEIVRKSHRSNKR